MDLSCGLFPDRNIVKNAQLAESLGYERVWTYDSPALYGDPWIALGRVAEATDRIGLGTAVLIPSLRHVLVTASAIASLEDLAIMAVEWAVCVDPANPACDWRF